MVENGPSKKAHWEVYEFWTIFLSAPHAPLPSKPQILFLLSSSRPLWSAERFWHCRLPAFNWRGKNLGHSELEDFKRTKVQNQIVLVLWGKWPEIRRKGDFWEPLLTAMAQALPSLTATELNLNSDLHSWASLHSVSATREHKAQRIWNSDT